MTSLVWEGKPPESRIQLTEARVLTYVDQNADTLTETDIEDWVDENATEFDNARTLKVMGISRLCGHRQISGDLDQHRALIEYLKSTYGLWSNKNGN